MGPDKSECSLVPGRTVGMIAGGLIVSGLLLDAGLAGEKLLFGTLDGAPVGGGRQPLCPPW